MIVRRQRQHATEARRARGIAVLEHIAAAVHARTLAVPHGKHAVVFRAREQVGLLRAPDHGRAQVLVQARRELDTAGGQMFLGLPQLQVEAAQGRAAVAGNKAGGVQAGGTVAHLLHQRQSHQGLHARQIDPTLFAGVLVFEAVIAVEHGRGIGVGHGHGGTCRA